ncbi:protein-glutamine glutaminase family protein [Sorangium sp. So ce131]|uniref:protein-glutamine glutaminase family protein n=1 Tax=Sorangium sp. So ce131 TaxID=3133282 RepID=UPI003F63CEAE
MALATSACGSDEGPDSGPDPDIERSDAEALQGACQLPDGPRTFDQQKGPPEALDGDCVPTWTEAQLSAGFAAIRDERLLTSSMQPGFLRRIPWLAVDNGCEERAQAASYFLDQWGYPATYYARVASRPGKSLSLDTVHEPDGNVVWSHHVAPVVQVSGQLVVLDPAIDPERPLPIAEWRSRFSVPGDIDVALCRDHAVGAGCFDAVPAEPSLPSTAPGSLLHLRLVTEWRVQELLGRDPYRVLGPCPPWEDDCEPEPTPDPNLPPVLRRFASDQYDSPVWAPIYVIGDNFVEGVTTVRITGDGVDELAVIADINLRRIVINTIYPFGDYVVTAYNGALASQTMALTIE